MTMAMAVKATTVPSVAEGGLLLLAFGAGTLPSMLLASFLFGKLGPRLRGAMQKGAGLFVIALGLVDAMAGRQLLSGHAQAGRLRPMRLPAIATICRTARTSAKANMGGIHSPKGETT